MSDRRQSAAVRSYKTRRYNALLEAGFLPFEALRLRKLPKSAPGLAEMVTVRKGVLARHTREANRKGWSPAHAAKMFRQRVKKVYQPRKFRIQTGPQKGWPSVWALYRHYSQQADASDKDEYLKLTKMNRKRKGRVSLKDVVTFRNRHPVTVQ